MALKPIQAVVYRLPQYVQQVSYASFHRDLLAFKEWLAAQSDYLALYDLFDYAQTLRAQQLFDPVVQYFTLYEFAYQAAHSPKLQFSSNVFASLQQILTRLPPSYFAACSLFLNELYIKIGGNDSILQIRRNLLALLNDGIPLERFSEQQLFFLEDFYEDYVACLRTCACPVELIKLLVTSPQRYTFRNQLVNSCLRPYANASHRFDVLMLLIELFEESSSVQVDYDKISVRNSSLAVRIAKYHPEIAIRMFSASDAPQMCEFLQQIVQSAGIQRLFVEGSLDHLLRPLKSRFYDEVLLSLVGRLEPSKAALKKLARCLRNQTGYLGRAISEQFALQLSRLPTQPLEFYEDLADECKWDEYLVYICQLRALTEHKEEVKSKVRLSGEHTAHLNAERYRLGLQFECVDELQAEFLIMAGYADLDVLRGFKAAVNLLRSEEFQQENFQEEAKHVREMGYEQIMDFTDYLICAEGKMSPADFSSSFRRIQQDIFAACQRFTREEARRVWRALCVLGQ